MANKSKCPHFIRNWRTPARVFRRLQRTIRVLALELHLTAVRFSSRSFVIKFFNLSLSKQFRATKRVYIQTPSVASRGHFSSFRRAHGMTIPGSVFSPPLRDKFEAPEVFLGPAGLALDH